MEYSEELKRLIDLEMEGSADNDFSETTTDSNLNLFSQEFFENFASNHSWNLDG